MKLVLLACLFALSAAAPQFLRPSRTSQPFIPFIPPQPQNNRIIQVLRDSRDDRGDGNYNYEFETENGIYTNVEGRTGLAGQTNQAGSFRFTLPDGTLAEVTFVADEAGFRAQSPLLPQAPPMPAHALEQIRKAEEERARGVQFDNRGFRIGGF
ncbi:cuticle protein AMP1A-like [Portunus trituberculatus]|uniref:cuticle protein AMP1A-like n=1 Tax=Portunus trituberculatus TaxID=210409 RepID=UPI001E1CCEF1|nr:cuticle protein AMP1A-like [Portunus trituberculatus]